MSIYFNGRNLRDFGCLSDELDSLVRPEPDITTVKVPGKNGTVTFSNGRFENVNIKFDCIIPHDFYTNYAALMAFLRKDADYHHLDGNAEKDFFRTGRFKSVSAPKISEWFQRGTFTLTFDCKPQRWAKDGQDWMMAASGAKIYNRFLFPALPLLRVYGWGTVEIQGRKILINEDDTTPYIDIDCDLKDAYYGSYNRNSFIEVTDWPQLDPGENTVTLGDKVTKLEMIPRFWTI